MPKSIDILTYHGSVFLLWLLAPAVVIELLPGVLLPLTGGLAIAIAYFLWANRYAVNALERIAALSALLTGCILGIWGAIAHA
jgi:hypothetical protein